MFEGGRSLVLRYHPGICLRGRAFVKKNNPLRIGDRLDRSRSLPVAKPTRSADPLGSLDLITLSELNGSVPGNPYLCLFHVVSP